MKIVSTPQGTQTVDSDDVREIHTQLLQYAASIVNESPNLPMPLKRRGVKPVREANYRTGDNLLTLEVAEGTYAGIPSRLRKKVEQQLRDLCVEAVHRAILDNPQLFVGVVLGEARKGVDYFERYQQVTDTA